MTFAEWWDTLTEAEHRLLGKTNAAFVWLCATQAEREACAKLCDGWTHADGDRCAEAIRARGNV